MFNETGVGTIGENLTLSGLDWAALRPGQRLELGAALIEITRAASPCRKIAGSFQGGDFNRVSDRLHPGFSRLAARVLREGRVQAGDAVTLLP